MIGPNELFEDEDEEEIGKRIREHEFEHSKKLRTNFRIKQIIDQNRNNDREMTVQTKDCVFFVMNFASLEKIMESRGIWDEHTFLD